MTRIATFFLIIFCLVSCRDRPALPNSLGEQSSGFDYVPLDPLPVRIIRGEGCVLSTTRTRPVLSSLPDNAVRIATRQISGSASGTLGPARIGTSGNQYQVILDYINADVVNVRFRIISIRPGATAATPRPDGPETLVVQRLSTEPEMRSGSTTPNAETTVSDIVIPVYVGVGLRLTANINVIRGQVNLGSLASLAAEAQAENISGSMIVQTLGITGPQVASSLPLPSELNQTTLQNAILALGSIKAIVYDTQGTVIAPRVTGIFNPLGRSDPTFVNLVVSELARDSIEWRLPCATEAFR